MLFYRFAHNWMGLSTIKETPAMKLGLTRGKMRASEFFEEVQVCTIYCKGLADDGPCFFRTITDLRNSPLPPFRRCISARLTRPSSNASSSCLREAAFSAARSSGLNDLTFIDIRPLIHSMTRRSSPVLCFLYPYHFWGKPAIHTPLARLHQFRASINTPRLTSS